jgi:hypothetical protein
MVDIEAHGKAGSSQVAILIVAAVGAACAIATYIAIFWFTTPPQERRHRIAYWRRIFTGS